MSDENETGAGVIQFEDFLKVELATGQPDLEILAADRYRFRGQKVQEPAIRKGISKATRQRKRSNNPKSLFRAVRASSSRADAIAILNAPPRRCSTSCPMPISRERAKAILPALLRSCKKYKGFLL